VTMCRVPEEQTECLVSELTCVSNICCRSYLI